MNQGEGFMKRTWITAAAIILVVAVLAYSSLHCGKGNCTTCCSCDYSCSGAGFSREGSSTVMSEGACLNCQETCLEKAAEKGCSPSNGTVTFENCSTSPGDQCSKSACDYEGQSKCDDDSNIALCVWDETLSCFRWGAKGMCTSPSGKSICVMIDGGAVCKIVPSDGGIPDSGKGCADSFDCPVDTTCDTNTHICIPNKNDGGVPDGGGSCPNQPCSYEGQEKCDEDAGSFRQCCKDKKTGCFGWCGFGYCGPNKLCIDKDGGTGCIDLLD